MRGKRLNYYELIKMNGKKVITELDTKYYLTKVDLYYKDDPVVRCVDDKCKFWYLWRVKAENDETIKVYEYIEDTKESEQTITLEEVESDIQQKQYKFWEILKMCEENKLSMNDILQYIYKGEEGNCSVRKFIEENVPNITAIFSIKEVPKEKQVTFEEVLNSDTAQCRVEHYMIKDTWDTKEFLPFYDILTNIGEHFHSGSCKEIIANGKWYIKL